MRELLFKTSFSKIYMIVMIIITSLVVVGYYSYAMFTVSKEKENAISIITGNLTYKLEVDGVESNSLTVESNTTKEFTVTLSNTNDRVARFNFYYIGSLPSNVEVGYKVENGINTPPSSTGVNLEKDGSSGSSNTYIIKVTNNSSSSVTITLGVEVGLDYNNLTLPSSGHLFEEISDLTVAEAVLASQGENGSTYNDGENTFITGTEPDNYIWYSGKLWRAVSVNNKARTTKLVTEWNISSIVYSSVSNLYSNFDNSFMKEWLNDTSVDGFLGNLRDYENFIVIDSKWDASANDSSLGSIEKPDGTNIATAAVGLLNTYEYQSSYHGTMYSDGYLNNGLGWWTLTPGSTPLQLHAILYTGSEALVNSITPRGIRPTINLKPEIVVAGGDGTLDNPYRLEGDNDTNLAGTLLSERYSGEYIRFGIGENQLYRIVSHENGTGTKITSAEPLRNSGNFIVTSFGNDYFFYDDNVIGTFLNNEYLTDYVGNEYNNMIESNTIWYLGEVSDSESYKLAKYTDATGTSPISIAEISNVGLLRYGELMAGQFNNGVNKSDYWTLTRHSSSNVVYIGINTESNYYIAATFSIGVGVKPSLNLKSNVVITGGDGTKQNPFTLELG